MTVASDKLLYIISPERLLLYIISPGQKGYIVLKNNKNWSTGLKESVFPGEISYTSLSVATVISDKGLQAKLALPYKIRINSSF